MRVLLTCLLICFIGTSASAQALKPGDTIDISVWQDSKLDRRLVISQSGAIAFPLAGHIQAGGLTPQALERVLQEKLKGSYNDKLDITVSLVSSREEDDTKPRVYVTGEVQKPGPYVLTGGRITLMQSIAMAGGLGPYAEKHRVQLHRKVNGVETVYVFDYSAFEANRDLTGNVDVRGGDVIVVPERGLLGGLLGVILD
jgi:polysaccharide biosynthesis/export protein